MSWKTHDYELNPEHPQLIKMATGFDPAAISYVRFVSPTVAFI
jgi:hypothetical protein